MSTKPLIGITYGDSSVRDNEMRIRTYVSRKYYQAIQSAGGEAILLPPVEDNSSLMKYLGLVDGLMIPGGEDVDPRFQNEDPHPKLDLVNPFRDSFELKITAMAHEMRIPVLGICRGIQVMAIALGGAIHQDISDICSIAHSQKAPRWATSHKVTLQKGSRLARWVGSDSLYTNSFHHQAIKRIPENCRMTGQTSDGIIEAIESTDQRIFVGVQWHPEETYIGDLPSQQLFKGFIDDIANFKA